MAILTMFETESEASENDQWERAGSTSYKCAATTDWSAVKVRQNLGSTLLINYRHLDDAAMAILNISVKRDFETGISPFVNPYNFSDSNTNTPCYWYDIEATYGPWNPYEHTATGNPVDQPLNPSFQWQIGEQPCDVAITGHNPDGSYIFSPVVNSANCPFDPAITRDELRCVIRVRQNVLTYNPAALWTNGNFINNDSSPLWNHFGQYTVKWTPPGMPELLYSQVSGTYYPLDHEFNFNPQGWNSTPIDRGTTQLGPGGVPEKILDLYGQPVSEPVLLDGSGNRLLNPTPSNIHTFDFQTCNDVNFGTFFGVAFQSLFP